MSKKVVRVVERCKTAVRIVAMGALLTIRKEEQMS